MLGGVSSPSHSAFFCGCLNLQNRLAANQNLPIDCIFCCQLLPFFLSHEEPETRPSKLFTAGFFQSYFSSRCCYLSNRHPPPAPNMICSVCYRMLRGHEGSLWRGTFDLQLRHHVDMDGLEKSAKMGCFICGPIYSEVQEHPGIHEIILGGLLEVLKPLPRRLWPEKKQVIRPTQQIVTRAGISHVPARNGLYRLEIRSKNSDWIRVLVLTRLGGFCFTTLSSLPMAHILTHYGDIRSVKCSATYSRTWKYCSGRNCPSDEEVDPSL